MFNISLNPFPLQFSQHSLWMPLIKIVTMSMSYTLRTHKGIVTYERTIYDTAHTVIVRNKTSLLQKTLQKPFYVI